MRNKRSVSIILSVLMLVICASSCSKTDNIELSSGVSRNVVSTDVITSDDEKNTEDISSDTSDNKTDASGEIDPEPRADYCFNDYLGLSRDEILDWLFVHEADDYYLGTPYGDEEIGFNTETCMRPNGRFADNYPHMTCTGFVLDVLMQSSGDRAEEVHQLTVDMMNLCENNGWANDLPYYRNEINAYYWGAFITEYENGKIYSVKFDTINDLLTSHMAKKGDILFFMPDSTVYGRNEKGYPCDLYGNPIDCHIGFYWGEDNSGENLFWHSMTSGLVGDPMDKSVGDFNQISQLTTPSVYTYVLLIPIR